MDTNFPWCKNDFVNEDIARQIFVKKCGMVCFAPRRALCLTIRCEFERRVSLVPFRDAWDMRSFSCCKPSIPYHTIHLYYWSTIAGLVQIQKLVKVIVDLNWCVMLIMSYF